MLDSGIRCYFCLGYGITVVDPNNPLTQENVMETQTWFQTVINGVILRFKTQAELAAAIREARENRR